MESIIIETPETTLTASPYQNENSSSENEKNQKGCCWPESKPWRFLGLFFMCFISFGSYFCYDNPAALQNNMMDNLGMNTSQFALLYSIYSWPNVVMVFVGGFLMDRFFGIRMGALVYMGIALIGTVIFAAGAFWNMFLLMMLGRFIFGIGSESLSVAQSSYAVLWFKGKELNMVFGLQLSFARVGSTVNFLVMEPLYNYVSKEYSGPKLIGIVLFVASLACVWSMICVCLMGLMDRRSERLLKRGHGEEPQVVKLSDVKDFKGTFWLVVAICISYYVAIFPFIALGKVFFMRKYSFDAATASTINSLLYSISAIASPLCGYTVDKTGRNIFWIIVSIAGTILSHGLMTFTYVNPYVCMSILALSSSMMAGSLWPSVALIVPEYQLGTAYGTAQALQSVGLAIAPMLAGIIVDSSGFFMLGIFFLAWLIAFGTGIILWLSDSSKFEGYMNMSPEQRKVHEANRSKIVSTIESDDSTSNISAGDHFQPLSKIRVRRSRTLED